VEPHNDGDDEEIPQDGSLECLEQMLPALSATNLCFWRTRISTRHHCRNRRKLGNMAQTSFENAAQQLLRENGARILQPKLLEPLHDPRSTVAKHSEAERFNAPVNTDPLTVYKQGTRQITTKQLKPTPKGICAPAQPQ
jgi:hypothetical protein